MKRILLVTYVLFFVPFLCVAQNQDVFGAPQNIRTGTLSNGVTYYLASNSGKKGFADFALVLRDVANFGPLRKTLAEPQSFSALEPKDYFASKSVKYAPYGFIQRVEDAAVVRFNDVPVFDRKVSDCTLLMLFELMKTSPSAQAIIVCGDIDLQNSVEQLQILAMSVPAVPGQRKNVLIGKEEIPDPISIEQSGSLARITLNYTAPALSSEQKKGNLPVVSRSLASQLGFVLEKRIRDSFGREGIPFAGINTTIKDSFNTSGQECYSVSVSTSLQEGACAKALVEEAAASLATSGAGQTEFLEAKSRLRNKMLSEAGKTLIENKEYMQRCISAYMFGSILTSSGDICKYFDGRNLPLETELEIFNKYCSAMLSPFGKAQASEDFLEEAVDQTLIAPKTRKLRIESSMKDAVTGGEIWTLSNGLKVIYKKVQSQGFVNYCFAVKGGMLSVPGLQKGESAFVNDILQLYDNGGIRPRADVSQLRIEGFETTSNFEDFLISFANYAKERKHSEIDFEYFKSCESLRIKEWNKQNASIRDAMQDYISPKSQISSLRAIDNLTSSLPSRVEKMLYSSFSRAEDAVFVVVGDISSENLKDLILKYAGVLGSGHKAVNRDLAVNDYLPGWHSCSAAPQDHSIGSSQSSVNFLTKFPASFSMKNILAFQVACEILELKMGEAMASSDYFLGFDPVFFVNSPERISLFVSCSPCDVNGLPDSARHTGIYSVQGIIRQVMTTVSTHPLGKSDFDLAKSLVSCKLQTLSGDPSYLVWASCVKELEGKNILSGYQSHLESLSLEDVQEMLSMFDGAVKVEYINR